MSSIYNQTLTPQQALDAAINQQLKPADHIDMLTQMIRIRAFEERTVRAYQQGHIGGFCHTYIGQESIAVGTVSVLGQHDHIITSYRDHGHAFPLGMSMKECMAELFGKYTGCSKGKGGSMHFLHPINAFGAGMVLWGAKLLWVRALLLPLNIMDKLVAVYAF